MQTFMRELLRMSLSGGLLILVVLVLRLLLKRAPKAIHCVLWAMVAIRLICPFTPQSPLSLIPKDEAVIQTIRHVQEPIAHSDVTLPESAAVGTPAVQAPPPAAATGTSASPTLSNLLPRFWLAGLTAMLVYMAASYLKVHLSVRESIPGTDNVRFCDRFTTPFVLGFFRPRIYMPTGITREEQRHVLCHENAHLLRRDHWWKPLGFLILSVHWFNPLVWAAYMLFCRDIELACDERVIREMDEREKADYSRTLLKVSTTRKFVSACPLAFGETSIKRRIKAVLHYKKPAFWIIIVSIVACAVVAVCFLTNPPSQKAIHLKVGESEYYNGTTQVYSPVQFEGRYYLYWMSETTYRVTAAEDGYVLQRYAPDETAWEYISTLTEIKLTKENWDDWFFYPEPEQFYIRGVTPESLRENNRRAWQAPLPEGPAYECYTLLEQKNGELFLALIRPHEHTEDFSEIYSYSVEEIVQLHTTDHFLANDAEYWAMHHTYSGYLPESELEQIHFPTLMLSKTGNEFEFVYTFTDSHSPSGTYTMADGLLKLTATDSQGNAEKTYQFRIVDDPYYGIEFEYDAENSDIIPGYKISHKGPGPADIIPLEMQDGARY